LSLLSSVITAGLVLELFYCELNVVFIRRALTTNGAQKGYRPLGAASDDPRNDGGRSWNHSSKKGSH